jgi:hypothetical protein
MRIDKNRQKLEYLGKTLNLRVSQLPTFIGGLFMYTLFAQIARLLSARPAVQEDKSLASQLMSSADACAGNSPHHAQELREAAYAYLSVVR